MKIAIPLHNGKLSMHFGHCEKFALIDADAASKKITNRKDLTPPAHEPGVLPKWLHQMGADLIIAGGMGQRAQQLFAQNNIEIIVGADADTPENLVNAYMNKTLKTGENVCDH
jgi:predicted Fe-Mo cluster-binding NifX family protein